jgi:hypothetical protein
VPEELDDLFAGLRADTIRQIRPPGADRVRRTVRRRRAVTVSFAGVLLLVLGGTVALLGFPSRPTAPAGPDRLTQAELDRLTGAADKAVTASNPGPAVFSRRGPVLGVITATEQIYLGEINLQVACAGTGSMTLLVLGTPAGPDMTGERPEVARLTVPCSAEPVPTGTTFVLNQFADVTVELIDARSARGRAGFAYRATSDTGRPAARGVANDPLGALRLPTSLPPGTDFAGGGPVTEDPSEFGFQSLNGDYRLALACAGTGRLRITVRQARSAVMPSQTVVATESFEAACRYPPQRQDFALGAIRNRQVSVTVTYESSSPAPGEFAFHVLPS